MDRRDVADLFSWACPDVLPVDDFGVRNGFRIAYEGGDARPLKSCYDAGTLAAVSYCCEAAAWYLWRAVDQAKPCEPRRSWNPSTRRDLKWPTRAQATDADRPGNFYVDATCINCDACPVQLAPAGFEEVGDYSAVVNQAVTAQEVRAAYRALLACPPVGLKLSWSDTLSLKCREGRFPLLVEDEVYYSGYNSESPSAPAASSCGIRMATG